ncbi:hypothetical protein BLA29_010912 [Euroglyphus maynei]|uniref:Uncharacterized protein n=1 Tax=Euroglyphus maynei TaxID=6958 RepID=A0A1Y3B867_EURMA|nr:hypothetical protein BLA29_010912 [Euroglyphus maynei]
MTSPFSTPKTTVPLLSFGSSLSSSSPSIVKPIESKTDKSSSLFSFGTTTTNSATDASLEKTTKPNTDSTSTTSTSSSLFVFGGDSSKSGITFNKNDKESSNEENNKNKTITPFGFNAISSTSSSTDTKPPMSTGLFSFGGAKPSDSSKPSLPSSFSKGMRIV